jgi:RNA polymerase sigma-70 factor (ECF subfamily)
MDREFVATSRLISEARAGNQEAYAQLFQTHRDYLKRQLRGSLKALSRAQVDASDVVQDALMDVLRSFPAFEYRGRGSFRRWLKRIIQNRLRMSLRRVRVRVPLAGRGSNPSAVPTSKDASVMPLARTDSSPSAAAQVRERRDQIEQVLAMLPADYRHVIRLVKLREMSMAEVARAMGRSENAAKKLLARALLQMRKTLADLRVESGK